MNRSRCRSTTILCAIALAFAFMTFGASEVEAQRVFRPLKQQRRQERVQKRIEQQQGNRLAPSSETVKPSSPAGKHSLDGIRVKGIAELFPKEERELVIRGFGRPAPYLIVLRQLDLTPEQTEQIKALSRRIGNQLVSLRVQHNQLDQRLEDSIYGDNFEQKQIDDLAAQSGQRMAAITRMQANIEAEFRQILTQDQFYVFKFLVGELLLPQRRQQTNQIREQHRRLNQQQRQDNN